MLCIAINNCKRAMCLGFDKLKHWRKSLSKTSAYTLQIFCNETFLIYIQY